MITEEERSVMTQIKDRLIAIPEASRTVSSELVLQAICTALHNADIFFDSEFGDFIDEITKDR